MRTRHDRLNVMKIVLAEEKSVGGIIRLPVRRTVETPNISDIDRVNATTAELPLPYPELSTPEVPRGPGKPAGIPSTPIAPAAPSGSRAASEGASRTPPVQHAQSSGRTAIPSPGSSSAPPKRLRAGRLQQQPEPSQGRLVSLDAFRGFIMMMLAAGGFGLLNFSKVDKSAPVWSVHNWEVWQQIGFHFDHPAWVSIFDNWKVSFWDLIQPAFMFMVGVSMPFSYGRREARGEGWLFRALHAFSRSVILTLMGVFLYSLRYERTNWIFPNVLCQIGLGYFFAWLLLHRKPWVQYGALVVILVGYWGWFKLNPPPAEHNFEAVSASKEKGEILEGRFAPWSKNGNAAFFFDEWFLPQLRQAPVKPTAEQQPAASRPSLVFWRFASVQQDSAGQPGAAVLPQEAATVPAPAPTAPATLPQTPPAETSPPDPGNSPPAATPESAAVPSSAVPSADTPALPAFPAAVPDPAAAAVDTSPTPAPADTQPAPADNGPAVRTWYQQWFFSNPKPYESNTGGYTTLNFIPSIATTLLGILCGQWLLSNSIGPWKKLLFMVILAAVCFSLGIAAHLTVCPIVKRIWTPSWVLFSGGYVIAMLSAFYLVFDILPLRMLAFPLVVVGTNSILIYMMGQTISGWMRESVVKVHLSGFLEHVFGPKALDPLWYGTITLPTTVFLLYWLFLLWLYRQKIFLRI